MPGPSPGWTITNNVPGQPYGRYEAQFVYNADDHDDGLKTFLGETGRFNGEDIVDIIAKQPAAARFLSRHLYNYFVADDAQVPSWMETPPQDPETIQMLEGRVLPLRVRHTLDVACVVQLGRFQKTRASPG